MTIDLFGKTNSVWLDKSYIPVHKKWPMLTEIISACGIVFSEASPVIDTSTSCVKHLYCSEAR